MHAIQALSIKAKVMAGAWLVVGVLISAGVLTFFLADRQTQDVRQVSDVTTAVTMKILPLVKNIETIRYDVVQVQQWLTDAVAVGTQEALTSGKANAEQFAASFKSEVAAAIRLAADLGRDDIVADLRETENAFAPYLATGIRMAHA